MCRYYTLLNGKAEGRIKQAAFTEVAATWMRRRKVRPYPPPPPPPRGAGSQHSSVLWITCSLNFFSKLPPPPPLLPPSPFSQLLREDPAPSSRLEHLLRCRLNQHMATVPKRSGASPPLGLTSIIWCVGVLGPEDVLRPKAQS